MAYSDKVVDHYNNPRNVGTLDKSAAEVGTGLVGAPECGDVMRLQIRVNPETNVIEDAKFKTFGCGSAIASSSLATEWVKGKTIDEATARVAASAAMKGATPLSQNGFKTQLFQTAIYRTVLLAAGQMQRDPSAIG